MNETIDHNHDADNKVRLFSKLTAVERLGNEIEFAEKDDLELLQKEYISANIYENPPVERAILKGVQQAIDTELKIRRAWNSSKGKWYAIASKVTWDSHKQLESTGEEIEAIECTGKDKAIEKGRELYNKYSVLFDDLNHIEVEIMPAIAYWKYPRGIKKYL